MSTSTDFGQLPRKVDTPNCVKNVCRLCTQIKSYIRRWRLYKTHILHIFAIDPSVSARFLPHSTKLPQNESDIFRDPWHCCIVLLSRVKWRLHNWMNNTSCRAEKLTLGIICEPTTHFHRGIVEENSIW